MNYTNYQSLFHSKYPDGHYESVPDNPGAADDEWAINSQGIPVHVSPNKYPATVVDCNGAELVVTRLDMFGSPTIILSPTVDNLGSYSTTLDTILATPGSGG